MRTYVDEGYFFYEFPISHGSKIAAVIFEILRF